MSRSTNAGISASTSSVLSLCRKFERSRHRWWSQSARVKFHLTFRINRLGLLRRCPCLNQFLPGHSGDWHNSIMLFQSCAESCTLSFGAIWSYFNICIPIQHAPADTVTTGRWNRRRADDNQFHGCLEQHIPEVCVFGSVNRPPKRLWPWDEWGGKRELHIYESAAPRLRGVYDLELEQCTAKSIEILEWLLQTHRCFSSLERRCKVEGADHACGDSRGKGWMRSTHQSRASNAHDRCDAQQSTLRV